MREDVILGLFALGDRLEILANMPLRCHGVRTVEEDFLVWNSKQREMPVLMGTGVFMRSYNYYTESSSVSYFA